MFEGIFTAKTKKKNDERFVPGRKEGTLFGGNYEDTGFLPVPSQFASVKKPNKPDDVLEFEDKMKNLASAMNLN